LADVLFFGESFRLTKVERIGKREIKSIRSSDQNSIKILGFSDKGVFIRRL
jgi:hypothetical protein